MCSFSSEFSELRLERIARSNAQKTRNLLFKKKLIHLPIQKNKQMKVIKPIYVSAFFIAILSSCSTAKGPMMVGTNPANIDKAPLKTSPIKEADLQRWSQLDYVKDTIPGMSVDMAYEFLKGKKANKIIVGVVDSGLDIDQIGRAHV